MIFTGLPVVSTPYMPAALMPMPCWPRLIRKSMKFRSIQQLAEDQRNLFLDDAGAVVLHANLVAVRAGLLDVHPQLRQNARLFACIQRIVDRLFHRGQKRLARIVETQQMAILGEEFAD